MQSGEEIKVCDKVMVGCRLAMVNTPRDVLAEVPKAASGEAIFLSGCGGKDWAKVAMVVVR